VFVIGLLLARDRVDTVSDSVVPRIGGGSPLPGRGCAGRGLTPVAGLHDG
jgi:hypothetical protein